MHLLSVQSKCVMKSCIFAYNSEMYTKKMVYCRNKYKQWLRKLFFQISSLNEYLVDKVTKMS